MYKLYMALVNSTQLIEEKYKMNVYIVWDIIFAFCEVGML